MVLAAATAAAAALKAASSDPGNGGQRSRVQRIAACDPGLVYLRRIASEQVVCEWLPTRQESFELVPAPRDPQAAEQCTEPVAQHVEATVLVEVSPR
jgi:hypothetical protein